MLSGMVIKMEWILLPGRDFKQQTVTKLSDELQKFTVIVNEGTPETRHEQNMF